MMSCQGAGPGQEVGVRSRDRDSGDPGAGQGSRPRIAGPGAMDPGLGV